MTSAPFTSYFFEDLSIGMSESIMKTVMANDVVGFATLSGDHNPIHLSDHFARKTRFGGRIAHGLYTASLISAVLGMYLPGPGAVYLSQTLNFRAPVRIGDVVSVSVRVVELLAEGRRCTLQCECVVDGKVVLDGQALVMVPSRFGSARPAPVAAPAPVKAARKTKIKSAAKKTQAKTATAKKPAAKRPKAKNSVSKKPTKTKRRTP